MMNSRRGRTSHPPHQKSVPTSAGGVDANGEGGGGGGGGEMPEGNATGEVRAGADPRGQGSFGFARDAETGQPFAVKILDRKRILELKIGDQIKREIGTLKLLNHPNVVRLHEVSASKMKIYMVLEYVNGGELFNKIHRKGRLSEQEGRKLFQQLIDAISYCHEKGVYHRDLKPENILINEKGNIKISDFGLSALSQHLGNDGLLHTTCGSPNYVAPEVIANRGYDGATSDIWSCGVILYLILTGSLPFEDRNMVVLYQKIFKGDTKIPKWLSLGAQSIIRRILDPNPKTRINVEGIKEDEWFKQDYTPILENDDEEDVKNSTAPSPIKKLNGPDDNRNAPTLINAFQLIGMSSCLDLSGFFEKEDVSERKIRFTSNYAPEDLCEKIEHVVTNMGFEVQKGHGNLKVMHSNKGSPSPKRHGSLSVAAEVFELSQSLYVVELWKSYGDSILYRELCRKISDDLGVCKSTEPVKPQSLTSELNGLEENMPLSAL